MSAKRAPRTKMGRPPISPEGSKGAVLIVRVSEDEKRAIEAAAARTGESVSALVRRAALNAANASR